MDGIIKELDGMVFMSINLKLELECLMSELKQDIWGKHEGCPEINK